MTPKIERIRAFIHAQNEPLSIPPWLVTDFAVSAEALRLWLYIRLCSRDSGRFDQSIKTIAGVFNKSERTILNWLHNLETNNLIYRVPLTDENGGTVTALTHWFYDPRVCIIFKDKVAAGEIDPTQSNAGGGENFFTPSPGEKEGGGENFFTQNRTNVFTDVNTCAPHAAAQVGTPSQNETPTPNGEASETPKPARKRARKPAVVEDPMPPEFFALKKLVLLKSFGAHVVDGKLKAGRGNHARAAAIAKYLINFVVFDPHDKAREYPYTLDLPPVTPEELAAWYSEITYTPPRTLEAFERNLRPWLVERRDQQQRARQYTSAPTRLTDADRMFLRMNGATS